MISVFFSFFFPYFPVFRISFARAVIQRCAGKLSLFFTFFFSHLNNNKNKKNDCFQTQPSLSFSRKVSDFMQ